MAIRLGCTLVFSVGAHALGQVSFRGLSAPEGWTSIYAHRVTDSGVVMGSMTRSGAKHAFRWTADGGIIDLTPDAAFRSEAKGLANDGTTIGGTAHFSSSFHNQPFRIENGKLHFIDFDEGGENAHLFDLSGDGTTSVGWIGGPGLRRAYTHTAATGIVRLPMPSEWWEYSDAASVSRDGSVAVGSVGYGGWYSRAAVWTHGGIPTLIDGLSGTDQSFGIAVSGDGKVIVGESRTDDSRLSFMWTKDAGTAAIPTPPGANAAVPTALSFDGSVLVGGAFIGGPYSQSFLWTPSTGSVLLEDYLASFGVNLTGWDLRLVNDVSDDGRIIVGEGIHNGRNESWIVTIPAPWSAGIVLALAVRRRR